MKTKKKLSENQKKANKLKREIENYGKKHAPYNIKVNTLTTFNIRQEVKVLEDGTTDTVRLKKPKKIKIEGVKINTRKSKNLINQFNKLRKKIIEEEKIKRENEIREKLVKEAKALGKRPIFNEEEIKKQARLTRREYQLLSFKKIYSEGINTYTGEINEYGEPVTKVLKGKAAIKHKITVWTRDNSEIKKNRFLQTYKHYGDQKFSGNPMWNKILEAIGKLTPEQLNRKIAMKDIQIQDPYTVEEDQLQAMYNKIIK